MGLVYERTDEAHDGEGTTVALAALYYNPYASWRLGIGAGQEEVRGSHGHTENLYRFSIAYHFHVGKFGLAPVLNVDRVDGDNALVMGLSFFQVLLASCSLPKNSKISARTLTELPLFGESTRSVN